MRPLRQASARREVVNPSECPCGCISSTWSWRHFSVGRIPRATKLPAAAPCERRACRLAQHEAVRSRSHRHQPVVKWHPRARAAQSSDRHMALHHERIRPRGGRAPPATRQPMLGRRLCRNAPWPASRGQRDEARRAAESTSARPSSQRHCRRGRLDVLAARAAQLSTSIYARAGLDVVVESHGCTRRVDLNMRWDQHARW